ncbi:MAG: DUF3800 domain-containing protein [Anaerolineae bacterium]
MYLAYVDESGDDGLLQSPLSLYILSAVIVHETDWNAHFEQLAADRRSWPTQYGLRQRTTLKARDLANGQGDFHFSRCKMNTRTRFGFYRQCLGSLAALERIRVLNIAIRKDVFPQAPDRTVFETAWTFLLQRYHTFLAKGGVLGRVEHGIVIHDSTRNAELRGLMRKMRAYNPVPSDQLHGQGVRDIPVTRLLDDPIPRDDRHSYYIQMADIIAYSLARRDIPRPRLERHGFSGFFRVLEPVLLKDASRYDPYGIVYYPK